MEKETYFKKEKETKDKFKLYLSTYPAGGARRNRQPEEIICPRTQEINHPKQANKKGKHIKITKAITKQESANTAQ